MEVIETMGKRFHESLVIVRTCKAGVSMGVCGSPEVAKGCPLRPRTKQGWVPAECRLRGVAAYTGMCLESARENRKTRGLSLQ